MKAITIKQPWASLIALGEKRFETRSWKTKHRGALAIHAGKSIDKEAYREFAKILAKHGIESINHLPTGSVVALAELVKCHEVINDWPESNAAEVEVFYIDGNEYKFGFYEAGRYAWELANVQKLTKPVLAKGKLSVWEWNGDSQ